MTQTQKRLMAKLVDTFGGIATTQMIGRKVWITLQNDSRNWFRGDVVFGTIGPRGQLRLKMNIPCCGYTNIHNEIGIEVHLKTT